jgi:hypothetical protein
MIRRHFRSGPRLLPPLFHQTLHIPLTVAQEDAMIARLWPLRCELIIDEDPSVPWPACLIGVRPSRRRYFVLEVLTACVGIAYCGLLDVHCARKYLNPAEPPSKSRPSRRPRSTDQGVGKRRRTQFDCTDADDQMDGSTQQEASTGTHTHDDTRGGDEDTEFSGSWFPGRAQCKREHAVAREYHHRVPRVSSRHPLYGPPGFETYLTDEVRDLRVAPPSTLSLRHNNKTVHFQHPSIETAMETSSLLQWLAAALPVFTERGERVVLYCERKKILHIVVDKLQEVYDLRYMMRVRRGLIDPNTARAPVVVLYHGQLADEDRAAAEERMASSRVEELPVLCFTSAGHEGVAMKSANVVILVDYWFNHGRKDQARARPYRFGQTLPVRVITVHVHSPVARMMEILQLEKAVMTDNSLGDQEPIELSFSPALRAIDPFLIPTTRRAMAGVDNHGDPSREDVGGYKENDTDDDDVDTTPVESVGGGYPCDRDDDNMDGGRHQNRPKTCIIPDHTSDMKHTNPVSHTSPASPTIPMSPLGLSRLPDTSNTSDKHGSHRAAVDPWEQMMSTIDWTQVISHRTAAHHLLFTFVLHIMCLGPAPSDILRAKRGLPPNDQPTDETGWLGVVMPCNPPHIETETKLTDEDRLIRCSPWVTGIDPPTGAFFAGGFGTPLRMNEAGVARQDLSLSRPHRIAANMNAQSWSGMDPSTQTDAASGEVRSLLTRCLQQLRSASRSLHHLVIRAERDWSMRSVTAAEDATARWVEDGKVVGDERTKQRIADRLPLIVKMAIERDQSNGVVPGSIGSEVESVVYQTATRKLARRQRTVQARLARAAMDDNSEFKTTQDGS